MSDRALWWLLSIWITFLGIMALSGCKTKIVTVPVETIKTEYKFKTDTVKTTDSIFHETNTLIMQVDSAKMAELGIQIGQLEKAWLIKEKEYERLLNKHYESIHDTLIVRDTIPQIVTVEKPLTRWQQWKQDIGEILIVIALIGFIYLLIKVVSKVRKNVVS